MVPSPAAARTLALMGICGAYGNVWRCMHMQCPIQAPARAAHTMAKA